MDHDHIEQNNIVDRYLMGRLVVEESEKFEEHFIDCPICIDRLNTTRDFRQGLRLLAVQQPLREESYGAEESRRFFMKRSSWKPLALAACGLLLIAIAGSILLFNQVRRLRNENSQAISASAEWQRRYEEQQQITLSSEQERQQIERSFKEEVSELEAKLQNEEKQRASAGSGFQRWARPGINIQTFVLESVRGSGQSNIKEIDLPGTTEKFTMAVPIEGEAKYENYRATILANNRQFWRETGLKPDLHNLLTMEFPSDFFRPGNYLLRIEGLPHLRDAILIGNYPFRITKKP